ncbi:fasciclin domain-containing protein [Aequorivita sp. Q41]|uniref:fasciclin domain-containing protein n=1 Tax=Aequorivita sp. Q41 TaxID=3153300 RepID=UPI0032423986
MKSKTFTAAVFSIALMAGTTSIFAQSKMTNEEKTVRVGGAAMYPSKNIVENAVNSKDHTTLVAAVKAASLVETLQGEGPFTVFAPTNAAFNKLPEGTLETLVKPENKAKLQSILTYHVLAGNHSVAAIEKDINEGNGKATYTTVNGGTLTAMMKAKKVVLMAENGGMATVTIADVNQSNGVIHVIDSIVLPK